MRALGISKVAASQVPVELKDLSTEQMRALLAARGVLLPAGSSAAACADTPARAVACERSRHMPAQPAHVSAALACERSLHMRPTAAGRFEAACRSLGITAVLAADLPKHLAQLSTAQLSALLLAAVPSVE